jgi:hypothetical protein
LPAHASSSERIVWQNGVLNRDAATGVSIGDMRNLGTCSPVVFGSALVGAVILAAAPAHADDVAGAYEAKFEQVATNCEHPVAYPPHGSIKIEIKGNDLQVDIERTPLMLGTPRKDGKINAKSRPGHTPIEGMDGVFTVAGRITGDGMLALSLIGEYQAAGKPLCTQSWTLSGLKAKSDKPDARPKR